MSSKLRRRSNLVSFTASYISLTKGLSPLLDRIGAAPYSPGRTISTPVTRLLRRASWPAPSGRRNISYRQPLSMANQISEPSLQRNRHG
jgi:hypothetical protein